MRLKKVGTFFVGTLALSCAFGAGWFAQTALQVPSVDLQTAPARPEFSLTLNGSTFQRSGDAALTVTRNDTVLTAEQEKEGSIQAGDVWRFYNDHFLGTITIASVPTAANATETSPNLTAEQKFVASSKGTKYYYSDCSEAKRIKSENMVTFPSAAAAQSAGYSPSQCVMQRP